MNPLAFKTFCRQIIDTLQSDIKALGLTPRIHFELEGTYRNSRKKVNFTHINQQLASLKIQGELKPEYWTNQWEYVSLFKGQTPLQEADYLVKAVEKLPGLFAQQGINDIQFEPVSWHGDERRYIKGSSVFFEHTRRSVHVPNAIQINVSVEDNSGTNLIATSQLGEHIQNQLIQTAYANCLLFLPEEDAFKRLSLKKDYDLDAELSSPNIISGGHQGSIALYRDKGKHNQKLGEEILLLDQAEKPILVKHNWHSTSRIEHRLGATSKYYDIYLNVLYILINVLCGIESWREKRSISQTKPRPLPTSINDKDSQLGALSMFNNDEWFAQQLDLRCARYASTSRKVSEMIKTTVTKRYLGNGTIDLSR